MDFLGDYCVISEVPSLIFDSLDSKVTFVLMIWGTWLVLDQSFIFASFCLLLSINDYNLVVINNKLDLTPGPDNDLRILLTRTDIRLLAWRIPS